MSLFDLQRDMRAWLTRDDAEAADRIGDDAAPGLRVYQTTYRAQLIACLDDGFDHVRDWIGNDAFHRAMAAHIDSVPPSSWTLDAYVRDFPATLGRLHPDDPEVAELGWLDLALAEAFVAPDAAALGAADLAEIDWDTAILRITPTLDIGRSTTNAPAIWQALAAGVAPPAAEVLSEAGAILVWRNGETSRFRATDQYEHQAMIAVRSGMPFAGLCQALVDALGEANGVARAGQMLGQWISDGLIVGIEAG